MTPDNEPAARPPACRARHWRRVLSAPLPVAVVCLMASAFAVHPVGAETVPDKAGGGNLSAASAIEVTGFGFGHGHGMGQWGAYGYATLYGWGYQQILAHYYEGAKLGHLAVPEPYITVHLTDFDGHDAVASALGGGGLVATWAGGASVSAAAVEVTRSGGRQVISSGPGCEGPWRVVATTSSAVTVAGASGGGGGAAGLSSSNLEACLPGTGPRVYQGYLAANPSGQTDNIVPLEDYVDGVVAAESPPAWADTGGEAALEALAVAARSVAIALVASEGSICDTTQCQVYKGLPDQYGVTADTAVSATAGQVLYCDAGSTCGPAGSVAVAEYSASTGGYTAGGAFPAVPDLGDAVAANPVHTWSVDIPVSQLEATFPKVGALQQLVVTERNGLGRMGGRVEELEVIGSNGSVGLTGNEFAADLDLNSDWFAVKGLQAAPATTTTSTSPAGTASSSGPPGSASTSSSTGTSGSPSTTGAGTSTSGGGAQAAAGAGTPAGSGTSAGAGPAAPPSEEQHDDLSNGYWVANSDGDVAAFGEATAYGTAAGTTLQGIVTGMATMPDDRGYWLVGSNGGVLAFGDASWYGSASKLQLARRVVGMAATPNGRGYWLVASDGGIFAYGNARFYGSTARSHLKQPIVGIAATPDGHGYWLVGSDGAVFSFGDAHFYGSAGNIRSKQRVVGIVPSSNGRGYFLVGKDGGIFAYGDARFLGSLPGKRVAVTVASVTSTNNGRGYYAVTTSGRVFAFGVATPARDLEGAGLSLAGAVAIVGYRSPTQP